MKNENEEVYFKVGENNMEKKYIYILSLDCVFNWISILVINDC